MIHAIVLPHTFILSMLSSLSLLVPYKLNTDDREPLFVLGGTWGVFVPSIFFWIQVLCVVLLQVLVSLLFSIAIYQLIVKNKSRWRFAVGYLVVIPLWLILPGFQLRLLQIQNKVISFCLAGIIPTLNIFHTTEAMHDCAPSHVTQSTSMFALYCASPMTLLWRDGKYVKASFQLFRRHLQNFVLFLLLSGVIQSIISPSAYQPFLQTQGREWYELARIFNWRQLGNNTIHALLFQMYLCTFSEGLLAATALVTGKRADTVMENPILESTSPSEFWGKRWNKVVHGILKRGVYLPARKAQLPKSVAVVATFLASSLFHEWLLTSIFYDAEELGESVPYFGGSTAFLLWNGFLLTVESLIWNWRIFQWMKYNLPKPIRTFLVIMLGLPVAHWFIDAYSMSNFFQHGQIAFFMILPINTFEQN